MIFCFLVSMLLQITSKKLESHLRHANAIRRLSMKKKIFIRAKTNVFSDHDVLNCDC